MHKSESRPRPGKKLIFTRFVTTRSGKRLDAHNYGKKAFVFEVDDKKR